MKTSLPWALTAVLALAVGFLGAKVLASGAPAQAPLVYGGTVTDAAGKPYAAAVPVEVALYDGPTGGAQKCKAAAVQAEAGTGRFAVTLPAECVQAVRDTPDLWSELTVGAGKTVLPRTHVAATPYALEADSAKTAVSAQVASGQLKTTVDGLVATVAGLKGGGGGGGPVVVDGAGVTLGSFVAISAKSASVGTPFVQIVTKTGALLQLGIDGKQLWSGDSLDYDGPNCTGNAYLSTSSSKWIQNYAVRANQSGQWFVSLPTTGLNYSNAPDYSIADVKSCEFNDIGCKNGSAGNGCFAATHKLKKVTAAEIGLPDVITPGLQIKMP